MEVEFASRQLRGRYERHREAVRAWGEAVARKYVQRIDVLYSAQRWEELATIRVLRLHPLRGRREGQFAITLHGRWRMILVPKGANAVLVEEVTQHYGD